MRLIPIPTRKIRSRYVYLAIATTIILCFRKWLYCISIVVHCFLTWNFRSTNFIGTNDDGFSLDLTGLAPPPEIDYHALLSARTLVSSASANASTTINDLTAAQSFIEAADSALKWGPDIYPSELVVPPILHQIVLGMSGPTPEKWLEASEACKAIHPDWTFMYWDDKTAKDFIAKEHPWFLETWMGYRYTIQKADSLRYLALYTYGGVYLDMDLMCKRPLDPFRKFPFVAPAAHPVGLSNGFMMSVPQHPFLHRLATNLPLFNRFFLSAYPTVMFSTGCMYVSSHHAIYSQRDELKVLGGENNRLNGPAETPLFRHLGASSWHRGDAKLFVQLGKLVKAIPILGTEGDKSANVHNDLDVDPTRSSPALWPMIIVMLGLVAFFAWLRYGRRRRSAKSSMGCASAKCGGKCCKGRNVVVLISEKEAWLTD